MNLYNLVILEDGDVLRTYILTNRMDADHALQEWVRGRWVPEEMDNAPYHNFNSEDMVTMWFEVVPGYDWSLTSLEVPAVYMPTPGTPKKKPSANAPKLKNEVPPAEDDILLTPGMCRIISYGLGRVEYHQAHAIMIKAGETPQYESSGAKSKNGELIVRNLRRQFRIE